MCWFVLFTWMHTEQNKKNKKNGRLRVGAVCSDSVLFLYVCAGNVSSGCTLHGKKPSHRCKTPQHCSGWSATVRPQLSLISPACRSQCTAARRTSVRGEPVLELRLAGAPLTLRRTWTAPARRDSSRPRKRRICQPKLRAHASLSHPCKVGPSKCEQTCWIDSVAVTRGYKVDRQSWFAIWDTIILTKTNYEDINNNLGQRETVSVSPMWPISSSRLLEIDKSRNLKWSCLHGLLTSILLMQLHRVGYVCREPCLQL